LNTILEVNQLQSPHHGIRLSFSLYWINLWPFIAFFDNLEFADQQFKNIVKIERLTWL